MIFIFIHCDSEKAVESVEPEIPKTAEEIREEKFNNSSSGWDGSHKMLVKLVKMDMHDPDSFKHDNTTIRKNGRSNYIVIMNYRGKNLFGAYVRGLVKVKLDDIGQIIELISQE